MKLEYLKRVSHTLGFSFYDFYYFLLCVTEAIITAMFSIMKPKPQDAEPLSMNRTPTNLILAAIIYVPV